MMEIDKEWWWMVASDGEWNWASERLNERVSEWVCGWLDKLVSKWVTASKLKKMSDVRE